MLDFLLALHSVFRWLVLLSILYCIFASVHGLIRKRNFNKTDNVLRSVSSAIAHTQLIIGFIVYFKSPVVELFRKNISKLIGNLDYSFFGVYHLGLMLIAIVLVTIGAAKAKRKESSNAKFRSLLIWYSLALVIIFIAIPWPGHPIIERPLLRSF